MKRRELLMAGGVLAAAAGSRGVGAAPHSNTLAGLAIDDPVFNVEIVGKLQGDLSGRQRYLYNPGFIFSVGPSGTALAPQDYGHLLLQVDGCTVRISRRLADGSVEERSDSWMFFCDPLTGEYLTEWHNPISGELLNVPSFRGGPSHSRLTPQGPVLDTTLKLESTALNRAVQLHWRAVGSHLWLSRHASSRITLPDGTARNEMSIDSWVCRSADVRDRHRSSIPSTYAWTSHGEWPAWFKLAGRPGNVVWRVESLLLNDVTELPPRFVTHTNAVLPGKLTAQLSFAAA